MAIVYSYPKVTSPLATDVLVLTDTTLNAGKRKNKTKSIAMSDVATYVIDTKSGITGTGTINKFPIFTASTVIGDSIITQSALGQGITVGGNLEVTNDTDLQGSLLADSLEVTNDSVFTGSARFNSTIKDTSGGVGTNGQVLTSTGTGVAWTTDAGGSVTGTGTTNYIAKWNTSSSIQDSIIFDNGTSVGIGTNSPQQKLHVNSGSTNEVARFESTDAVAYLSIKDNTTSNSLQGIGSIGDALTLYSNNAERVRIDSSGNVGIGTNNPQAKLHVNGSEFLVTQGNETGLNINNDTYIYKIGDISGGENQAYMQIDSAASKAFFLNSNVGIGTTSPTKDLEIGTNGGGETEFRMHSDESGRYFEIGANGNVSRIRATDNQNLIIESTGTAGYVTFTAGNSERMRVNYNGNVGIGTTNPSTKLEVISTANEDGIAIKDTSGNLKYKVRQFGGNTYSSFWNASNQQQVQISAGGTTYFNGGSVGIGTSSPASKLTVTGGDAEVTGSDKGLILESPNGTRYRIKVDNSGNLTTTAV
jgi:uncharacterized membrane protein